MRLTSYQPQYFPRLHYFARMLDTDIFALSDYLQYVRKHSAKLPDGSSYRMFSHQAHMPIKSPQGLLMLDIPVHRGGAEGKQSIHEAEIDYATDWPQRHVGSIETYYRRAPFFRPVHDAFASHTLRVHRTLAEYTIGSTLLALAYLFDMKIHEGRPPSIDEINERLPFEPFRLKKIVRMSETPIPPADKITRDANDWLIETCQAFGADEYYFGGTAASSYMQFEKFEKAGIVLVEQKWPLQQYPQLHGAFVPNLSIVDLLMNVSKDEARAILHTDAGVRR